MFACMKIVLELLELPELLAAGSKQKHVEERRTDPVVIAYSKSS